jgi:hypothetical protein
MFHEGCEGPQADDASVHDEVLPGLNLDFACAHELSRMRRRITERSGKLRERSDSSDTSSLPHDEAVHFLDCSELIRDGQANAARRAATIDGRIGSVCRGC